MTIVLIRHGETALNAARIVQPADTPLNERGIAQAQPLARRLAGGGVGRDPEQRPAARDDDRRTARRPDRAAGGLDRAPAGAQLRRAARPRLRRDRVRPVRHRPPPPGGESWTEFLARVAQAFAQLVALRATLPGPLAVVTHGLVVGAILRVHARLPAGVAMPERIANTSISVLAADAPHAASLVNCARHLEGKLADDAHGLSGF